LQCKFVLTSREGLPLAYAQRSSCKDPLIKRGGGASVLLLSRSASMASSAAWSWRRYTWTCITSVDEVEGGIIVSMLALVSLNYRGRACTHLFRHAMLVRWIDITVAQCHELGNTLVAIATLP
jgi:hypothetical protein